VVRLSDPQFAEAMREAADIRNALAVPAVAAPAFAAALFGDRVHTLITTADCRTLVVLEIVIERDDTALIGQSLRAVMLDYRLLPIAFVGRDLAASAGHSLQVGDRLTVVVELPDVERLIRRATVPATASVVVDDFPLAAKEMLTAIAEQNGKCSREEAEAKMAAKSFTLAAKLTRGTAQELIERVSRENVTARIAEADRVS
jgi:hypothetical protein